jgi:hypothetical protein
MDIRELLNDERSSARAAMLGALKSYGYVALPVTVEEDTADGHTVKVRPTIKGIQYAEDGTKQYVDLPVMADVPIQFGGGAGHHYTHPVKKGDEGFVVFMSRNIDASFQSGGVQRPVDHRMGNLSDAHFVPGTHSVPGKIKNYSKNTAQVRYGDSSESKVDVSNSGVLNQRGDNSQVHVVDKGVLARKEGSTTWVDSGRIDHKAPKVMINC